MIWCMHLFTYATSVFVSMCTYTVHFLKDNQSCITERRSANSYNYTSKRRRFRAKAPGIQWLSSVLVALRARQQPQVGNRGKLPTPEHGLSPSASAASSRAVGSNGGGCGSAKAETLGSPGKAAVLGGTEPLALAAAACTL